MGRPEQLYAVAMAGTAPDRATSRDLAEERRILLAEADAHERMANAKRMRARQIERVATLTSIDSSPAAR